MKYFLWGVGVGMLGLIIAIVGIFPFIDGDTSTKAPSYSSAVYIFGLAIMFLGPFVFWFILPITINIVRHFRLDLESRVIWGAIGRAIGTNATIALIPALFGLIRSVEQFLVWGIVAFVLAVPFSLLVVLPNILHRRRQKSGRRWGSLYSARDPRT